MPGLDQSCEQREVASARYTERYSQVRSRIDCAARSLERRYQRSKFCPVSVLRIWVSLGYDTSPLKILETADLGVHLNPQDLRGKSITKRRIKLAKILQSFALGSLATMANLNPPVRALGHVPFRGHRVEVYMPYFAILVVCIAAALLVISTVTIVRSWKFGWAELSDDEEDQLVTRTGTGTSQEAAGSHEPNPVHTGSRTRFNKRKSHNSSINRKSLSF